MVNSVTQRTLFGMRANTPVGIRAHDAPTRPKKTGVLKVISRLRRSQEHWGLLQVIRYMHTHPMRQRHACVTS